MIGVARAADLTNTTVCCRQGKGLRTGSAQCTARSRKTTAAQCKQSLAVVVTREKGKNEKLQNALQRHSIPTIELPLIEHATGPDRASLPAAIKEGAYDWITVTSPEAATVFIDAWREAGSPAVKLAVVGGGTGEILQQAGLKPAFTASKATGVVLGSELPKLEGGSCKVLYPASSKASTDLQDSLAASGFSVTRLNTYDTRGVTGVEPQLLRQAVQADVVTFGSPSAVRAWIDLVGLPTAAEKVTVCIGSTSARACKAAGLHKVYHPDSPGIDGWVQSIIAALQLEDLSPKENVRDM